MNGVNRATLLGNLGADPELRYTQSGKAVCTFRIATSSSWTDDGGERQERTEWHRIVVWGRTAENCEKYLSKGRAVFVEGEIRTRKWQDRDGADRWTTEIVAQRVDFIGGGNGSSSSSSSPGSSDEPPPDYNDDDIPF